jgi:hypothetical protein
MRVFNRLIAATCCLVLLLTAVPLVKAQTTSGNGTTTGSGLSISPTISEYTIVPGGSDTVKITLKNITVDNVTAKGFVNDFTADGTTGNPKILTNQTTPGPNSIRNFIYGLTDVPLARGEQKSVTVGIQVPKDTTPGAYFGIIRYKAVPAGQNAPAPGQVALTASVGTIVLITIPGNVREQVQLKGLHVNRGGHDGTLFFGPPTSIGVEIANFGNGFIKPFGNVEVHNMFNKNVVSYQLNNPKQPGNILPGSSRVFTQNIKGINSFGRYTVIASVSYGKGNQVLSIQKNIWYIPIWMAVLFLVIVIGLIYIAYRSYRRYRRDNKHTVRK